MLKHTLLIIFCALLWSACSTPTSDKETISEATVDSQSRNSKSDLIGRESELILARAWKNADSTFIVDLRLDGSFVGEIEGQNLDGQWSISEDEKTLQLEDSSTAKESEEALKKDYTIISSNVEKVNLLNESGQDIVLTSLKK